MKWSSLEAKKEKIFIMKKKNLVRKVSLGIVLFFFASRMIPTSLFNVTTFARPWSLRERLKHSGGHSRIGIRSVSAFTSSSESTASTPEVSWAIPTSSLSKPTSRPTTKGATGVAPRPMINSIKLTSRQARFSFVLFSSFKWSCQNLNYVDINVKFQQSWLFMLVLGIRQFCYYSESRLM